MASQVGRILIQLVAVVVLSRLLAPGDFGLVAMVTAIVGLAEVFRDFGLTQASIQAKTLSEQQQSNLFWMNAAIGAVLTLLAISASWLIGELYGESRLVPLTQIISIVFVINGLSTQYRAQLSRQLRFGLLSITELIAPAVGLIVAIVMALGGASYWALAGQQVGTALAGLLFLVVSVRWLPKPYRRGHQMGGFLKYGGFLVLAQVVTYVSKNIDSVLIGSRIGAAQLGIYNRAFQILLVPLNQINAPSTRVALPVLARLQDEPARFNRYLLLAQSALLQPVSAMFALGAALAPVVVPIFLGDGWSDAIPIFQILALSGLAQSASYATYWVFLARGQTRSQLIWSLITRPFVILAVIVGSAWGLEGVAWGYTLGNIAIWPLGLLWIGRSAGAPALGMLATGIRAMVVYGAAALCAAYVLHGVTSVFVGTLLAVLSFICIVGLGLLIRAFRRDLAALWKLLQMLKKRRV